MIGTKAYITDRTGFLLDHRRPLAPQLAKALSVAPTLNPRAWAVEQIAAETNCRRLNACLKDDYLAGGNAWTEDVAQFFLMRFELYYAEQGREGGEYADDYARLKQDFGLELIRPERQST